MVVGAVAAFLVAHGINLSNEALAGLTAFLGALLSGLYYLVIRLFEKKFPEIGVFLGAAGKPKYPETK